MEKRDEKDGVGVCRADTSVRAEFTHTSHIPAVHFISKQLKRFITVLVAVAQVVRLQKRSTVSVAGCWLNRIEYCTVAASLRRRRRRF